MIGIVNYREILFDIKILEEHLSTLTVCRDNYMKKFCNTLPMGIRKVNYENEIKSVLERYDNEIVVNNILHLNNNIETININLKELYNCKKKIENLITSSDNFTSKIANQRFIEGLSLKQIAKNLNLSYDYVRHINSKINSFFN